MALTGLIERSVYNRRKRQLAFKIEHFRTLIAENIAPVDACHIVDSMPLEGCKFTRARRANFGREIPQTAPDYGYCAAQKTN